jgi:hypothetical protein
MLIEVAKMAGIACRVAASSNNLIQQKKVNIFQYTMILLIKFCIDLFCNNCI